MEWKVLGVYKTHDKIDIEAKKNTPVKAVARAEYQISRMKQTLGAFFNNCP